MSFIIRTVGRAVVSTVVSGLVTLAVKELAERRQRRKPAVPRLTDQRPRSRPAMKASRKSAAKAKSPADIAD